jgi:hypothetical protein
LSPRLANGAHRWRATTMVAVTGRETAATPGGRHRDDIEQQRVNAAGNAAGRRSALTV